MVVVRSRVVDGGGTTGVEGGTIGVEGRTTGVEGSTTGYAMVVVRQGVRWSWYDRVSDGRGTTGTRRPWNDSVLQRGTMS